MRPTPALSAIAERADKFVAGDGRECLSGFALVTLRSLMRAEESRLADEGCAFGDQEKCKLAISFSTSSPIAFLIALPEIIGANIMKFDDEEILEKCVFSCLDGIFLGGDVGSGEK